MSNTYFRTKAIWKISQIRCEKIFNRNQNQFKY